MKNTLKLATFLLTLGASTYIQAQTTAEQQKTITPDEVITELMEGNKKYVAHKLSPIDIGKQIKATTKGQHPKAVILSCIDSRVPVELVPFGSAPLY